MSMRFFSRFVGVSLPALPAGAQLPFTVVYVISCGAGFSQVSSIAEAAPDGVGVAVEVGRAAGVGVAVATGSVGGGVALVAITRTFFAQTHPSSADRKS